MARLRVRDPTNTYWLDICYHEVYVRNPANTGWRRILPGAHLAVRSSANQRWLQVNCSTYGEEQVICDGSDPYDPDNPLNPNKPGVVIVPPGGTTPGGGTGGSGGSGTHIPGGTGGGIGIYVPGGDGTGNSGGTYTPGYGIGGTGTNVGGDTPDGTEPKVIVDPSSPTGVSIITVDDNGITTIDTYDNNPDTTDGEPGTWDEPHHCPVTVFHGGTNICETYVTLGPVKGMSRMYVLVYAGNVRIEVYHGGNKIMDSGFLTAEATILNFAYDPGQYNNDQNLFVRAYASDPGSYWMYTLQCPGILQDTTTPGTPNRPEKCLAVVQPTWGAGTGVQETYHDLGNVSGVLTVEYQMFDQADKMGVFYKGQRIGGTNGFVSGEGSFTCNYTSDGVVTTVVVRVEGQEPGTSYVYRMYCPGQDGSAANPKPCGQVCQGSGAATVDIHHALGPNPGQAVVEYITFDIPDKIELYQGSVLKCATNGFVSEESAIGFEYNPADGQTVLIRVIGSVNTTDTTWAYIMHCPEAAPVAQIRAYNNISSLSEGNTGQGTFTAEVYLDKPALMTCTVEWRVIYPSNADQNDVPPQTGLVTFTRGQATATFNIVHNTDIYQEADELFAVELFNPVALTLGATTTASFMIVNDDVHAFVTISVIPAPTTGSNITEGQSGTVPVCADIVLSQTTTMPVTVNWAFGYGTAGPSDVIITSGQVTINPGETFQRVCCSVIGDLEVESDETFTCTISNPTFGAIQTNQTTFTILNDDTPPLPCNNQTQSGGSQHTERSHELGSSHGSVTIAYDMANIADRMRVYHMGNLLADTGMVSQTGTVNFYWAPAPGQPTQILVVMTSDNPNTGWEYTVYCPN